MNKHKKAKLKAAREKRLLEEFRDTYRICLKPETIEKSTYGMSRLGQFEIYKILEPKSEVVKFSMELEQYDESNPILFKDFNYDDLEFVNDFYSDSDEFVYFVKLIKK